MIKPVKHITKSKLFTTVPNESNYGVLFMNDFIDIDLICYMLFKSSLYMYLN